MPDFFYEMSYGRNEGKVICGIDEVGRGPLAGPVVAAAIILPSHLPTKIIKEIRDSKKMTPEKRLAVQQALVDYCIYAIAEASVEEIDELNILWASMLAMQRAYSKLNLQVDMALVDGNRAPSLSCNVLPIVKGDDKCFSIAAASIIAKVYRDQLMKDLSQLFPCYGWDHNAGYGTSQHKDALLKHGPSKWHRRSFAPVRDLARKAG